MRQEASKGFEADLLYLPVWQEIVGVFQGTSVDQHTIYVRINQRVLAFHNGSREATYARDRLTSIRVGTKIAILRTDLPNKPLLIRQILDEKEGFG